MTREQVPRAVSEILDDRPVRWAPGELLRGDFDGRERTLEIFMAGATEQRRLLRALRERRAELAEAAGGSIVFVFHTPAESIRLYAPFVAQFEAFTGGPSRTPVPVRVDVDLAELVATSGALLQGELDDELPLALRTDLRAA
jgi:hypothetical protein